jgi:hypothetical protein
MPGFNQFYLQTAGRAWRKLMVSKPSLDASVGSFWTNQMYMFTITNYFGCSFWNPYNSNFNSPNLSVHVRARLTQTVTNNLVGTFVYPQVNWSTNYNSTPGTFPNNYWPRTVWTGNPPSTALNGAYASPFIVPFNLAVPMMTNSIFRYPGSFVGPLDGWQTTVFTPQLPQLMVVTTNRLQAFILDGTHVVDYVHFDGPESAMDLTNVLADARTEDASTSPTTRYLWSVEPVDPSAPLATPRGVVNQILVSQGNGQPDVNTSGEWNIPPNLPAVLRRYEKEAAKSYFRGFFNDNPLQLGRYRGPDGNYYTNSERSVQAPYTPIRNFYHYTAWQANDPLVHHLASDLSYYDPGNTGLQRDHTLPKVNLGAVPTRWSAWGAAFTFSPSLRLNYSPGHPDATYLTQIKDSLVWRPDDWNFPSGKYPSVGWIGRVHRGTAWQSVYLKASDVLANADNNGNTGISSWAIWTGDLQTVNKNNQREYYRSGLSAPLQDIGLFDLFTTRLNENAARGTLSVNVGAGQGADGGLAAWSAVFSGLVALTNTTTSPSISKVPAYTNLIVSPAGVAGGNSALGTIVTNINGIRSGYRTAGGLTGTFTSVGDILRVPALTEKSPFLNWNNTDQQKFGISDQLYEWLPQQIVGLLRVNPTPRYVIYCLGQALRPAPESFVTDAANFGLCTNYQVVAEQAARAVVRVDRQVVNGTTNYTTTVESYNPLPPD